MYVYLIVEGSLRVQVAFASLARIRWRGSRGESARQALPAEFVPEGPAGGGVAEPRPAAGRVCQVLLE